jgi:hypothetical protein
VIARGMHPLAAVNAPRIHHQLIPHKVYAEKQRCLLDGPLRKFPEEEVGAFPHSRRIQIPIYLSYVSSYDVASHVYQALSRHVIQRMLRPRSLS